MPWSPIDPEYQQRRAGDPSSPEPNWVTVYIALSIVATLGAALIICLFCVLPAFGQTPTPVVSIFRDTVWQNDSDRNWTIIWTRGDPTDANSYGFFKGGERNAEGGDPVWDSVQLLDMVGQRWNVDNLCLRQQDWLECCFYRSFTIPAGTPNGKYSVILNAVNQGTLTVSTRTKPFSTITGRMTGLSMEPGRTYYGYNCVIMGNVKVTPGSSLVGATVTDATVSGLAADCVFKDCRFIRCAVGGMSVDWQKSWDPGRYEDFGCLYQNCHFDHSACSGCCSGCFLNCKWTGRIIGTGGGVMMAANLHNFVCERAKRLCMFNCTFDQTDRGPILRNQWGNSSDNLFVGVNVVNVNATNNGNEAICVEGRTGRFDRNLFFGFRAFNTTNDFQIFDTPASGNLIANSIFGKGCTVAFTGLQPQENNTVRNCELSSPVKVNNFGTLAVNTVDTDNRVK